MKVDFDSSFEKRKCAMKISEEHKMNITLYKMILRFEKCSVNQAYEFEWEYLIYIVID